jgi:hypothetical protein
MPKVPQVLIQLIEETEEKYIAAVFQKLHLSDTIAYKSYTKKYAKKNFEKEYLVKIFTSGGDVQNLYKTIEPYLLIGGCSPGVGIAFNLIDACFCWALGNWLGCLVAIISCFPIPGFKVVGKGLEKLLVVLLKRITPSKIMGLLRRLGSRLSNIGFLSDKSYIIIREQIEAIMPYLNNPFAESFIKEFAKVVKRFPVRQNGISKVVSKSGEELMQEYTLQPKLLEITSKSKILSGSSQQPRLLDLTINMKRW